MQAANIPAVPAVPAALKNTKPLAARLLMVVTHPNTPDALAACDRIVAGWEPIKSSEKDALLAYGAAVRAALNA